MILVASGTSPYARKIKIVLSEKQLPYELHDSLPWAADTDVSKYNPLGKVPALVDDLERIWFDSPVIAGYIETLPSAIQLIPTDPLTAVRVRQVEALADGACDAAVAAFLEKNRPEEQQNKEWITRQQSKVSAAIAAMNDQLAYNEGMCGSFSLADIAVVCFLEWFSFRFPEDNWKTKHPKLAGFSERIGNRASFKATKPNP